ncbi:hypothetical protein MRB53_009928 [Persea americana]|uniref:Uncharacterized protein n=1 Tax=Persea americana TaxID=3435 RepID=A0ACC2LRK2_PERAE|nr:hypothetical protein MRB53_009928 [Persea americana]
MFLLPNLKENRGSGLLGVIGIKVEKGIQSLFTDKCCWRLLPLVASLTRRQRTTAVAGEKDPDVGGSRFGLAKELGNHPR